jgi:hypothetical protein
MRREDEDESGVVVPLCASIAVAAPPKQPNRSRPGPGVRSVEHQCADLNEMRALAVAMTRQQRHAEGTVMGKRTL